MDHLRRGNPAFARLLEANSIVTHPFIVGELGLGGLRARDRVLDDLRALRQARLAEESEVMGLVERKRLWGRGIGWVDAHLLAAALLDQLRLWTLDRALATAAGQMGVGY